MAIQQGGQVKPAEMNMDRRVNAPVNAPITINRTVDGDSAPGAAASAVEGAICRGVKVIDISLTELAADLS